MYFIYLHYVFPPSCSSVLKRLGLLGVTDVAVPTAQCAKDSCLYRGILAKPVCSTILLVSLVFTASQTRFVGEQTQYEISQLHPAVKYTFQVRCITEHSERSEWSPETYLQLHSGESIIHHFFLF